MTGLLKKQWFLLSLLLVFILVMADRTGTLARIGIFLKNHHGPSAMIVIIFLASGLIIEVDQIKTGIKDIKTTAVTLGIIVILSPVFALALGFLPLSTGLILGLFLVAVMPTTLSSGVVMTGQAGGNIAHALFITIISNCVAIVSIPVVLPMLLGFLNMDAALLIDRTTIFIKLATLVLIPLICGLLLKTYLLDITATQKKNLSILNQAIVILIVYMSLSGVRDVLAGKMAALLVVFPLVVGFHMLLVAAAFALSRMLNIGKGRREAVVFMGSQKTLPLSVMLQMTCFPEHGAALMVCVIYHIAHLMIDGFLAVRMNVKNL